MVGEEGKLGKCCPMCVSAGSVCVQLYCFVAVRFSATSPCSLPACGKPLGFHRVKLGNCWQSLILIFSRVFNPDMLPPALLTGVS